MNAAYPGKKDSKETPFSQLTVVNNLGAERVRVGKHLPMVLGSGFDVTVRIPVFILLLRSSVLTLSPILIM